MKINDEVNYRLRSEVLLIIFVLCSLFWCEVIYLYLAVCEVLK
ncbi:hypothetical protein [Martelella alba]|nr:hypothetical protein [Martelella alba]